VNSIFVDLRSISSSGIILCRVEKWKSRDRLSSSRPLVLSSSLAGFLFAEARAREHRGARERSLEKDSRYRDRYRPVGPTDRPTDRPTVRPTDRRRRDNDTARTRRQRETAARAWRADNFFFSNERGIFQRPSLPARVVIPLPRTRSSGSTGPLN